MKRITAFAFGLTLVFLLQTACNQKLPVDAIYSSEIKEAYYKQELAIIKKEYSSDPKLQLKLIDNLLDLTDRIIVDCRKDCPIPGCPECTDTGCCGQVDDQGRCIGEACPSRPPTQTANFITPEEDPGLEIYDIKGVLIGSIDKKQKKTNRRKGLNIFPIKLEVEALPKRFDIKLIEEDQTYYVKYVRAD